MVTDVRRQIVETLLNQGILVNKALLEEINTLPDINGFYSYFQRYTGNKEKLMEFSRIIQEYQQKNQITQSEPSLSRQEQKPAGQIRKGNVDVIFSYKEEPKKRVVQDFTQYFTSRYNTIKLILQQRKELQNLTSINRLGQKRERGNVSIIGIVTDKQIGRTGKVIFTVEDLTGTIKVMVSQNSNSYDLALDTTLDEIIGIVGMGSEGIIFANTILIPDIPIFKELKKSPDEAYALFTGDFHFGSNLFIHEPFEKFLSWIRGEQGNEAQKEVTRKIKYLFLLGDLVEGVGIYPNQENDLEIKDIYEQYSKLSDKLRRIPEHIQIIICPGNHDAMRIAEPQPPLYKDFAEAIWNLPNVTMVSNPAYVNIHKSDRFPGFDVLMYHGFSFVHYADSIQSIRDKGGQARSDLIMKYVLQRRHLAPTHKSTLYLPDAHKDSLVIDKIPDIFATGHIHRVAASSYRNVTMLNCSCWLKQSEYQEKLGITPDPGRALLVNLQTRKVKILKFYEDTNKEPEEDED